MQLLVYLVMPYLSKHAHVRKEKPVHKQSTASKRFVVQEGKAKILVNLTDYLDTGLFLDHRQMRLRIANEARGKHFLNLFSYTSTASLHAALGGAASTTSVDLSNTYINWSKENFQRTHCRPCRRAAYVLCQ